MAETLLRVHQAAARLAVGTTTVYELLASGQLESLQLGRARRIPASAVDKLIAAKLAEAKAS